MKSIRIILQEDKIIDTVYKTYYLNEEYWDEDSEEWKVVKDSQTIGINSWERAIKVANYLLNKGE